MIRMPRPCRLSASFRTYGRAPPAPSSVISATITSPRVLERDGHLAAAAQRRVLHYVGEGLAHAQLDVVERGVAVPEQITAELPGVRDRLLRDARQGDRADHGQLLVHAAIPP
jgi:hypothetical protein